MIDHDLTAAELVPRPTPALEISADTEGRWRIDRISPTLAEAVSGDAGGGTGRRLGAFFDRAEPALESLADRCLHSGETVRTPIRLLPELPPLLAVLRPQGRNGGGRQVAVWFGEAEVVAEPAERFHDLAGSSTVMHRLFQRIRLYGRSDAPVAITGETGTGKELVARALHEESARRTGPFVAVNCSAISPELLESELFGHEKGAFTGAVRTHRGRFERAHGGTLFLDEIGDMPLLTQTRLLRVLETGRIERVGGEREQVVDVRVLCATHVPLEQAVAQGRFRADLYHRLAVLRLHVPPLRERLEDIPLLTAEFLRHFSRRYGRSGSRITPEALSLLQSYLWPGNVRELRNVLERVFVETPGGVIGVRAFAEWVRERQAFTPGEWEPSAHHPAPALPPPHQADRLPDVEVLPARRRGIPAELSEPAIRQAWRQTGGNLTAAARLLGVHRATLYRYLQRLGLSRRQLD